MAGPFLLLSCLQGQPTHTYTTRTNSTVLFSIRDTLLSVTASEEQGSFLALVTLGQLSQLPQVARGGTSGEEGISLPIPLRGRWGQGQISHTIH